MAGIATYSLTIAESFDADDRVLHILTKTIRTGVCICIVIACFYASTNYEH